MRQKNTQERILMFPPDRIAFLPNSQAATRDKAVFSEYRNGVITIALACSRIAENNGLPWVSREQFLNEYNITGWGYAQTEEDIEAINSYAMRHTYDI